MIRRTPGIGERVAKYNQLVRIEELLGDAASYAGAGASGMYYMLNHKGPLVVAAPPVEVPGISGWRRPGLNSCAG